MAVIKPDNWENNFGVIYREFGYNGTRKRKTTDEIMELPIMEGLTKEKLMEQAVRSELRFRIQCIKQLNYELKKIEESKEEEEEEADTMELESQIERFGDELLEKIAPDLYERVQILRGESRWTTTKNARN
jgi:hypothetical protein